jgi:hypothetical protein
MKLPLIAQSETSVGAVECLPKKEIPMRKTVLTILSASLIVVSAVQLAGAAGRTTHKSDRARVQPTEQFRNANNSLPWPTVEQQDLSDYSEGHVISAPAGR